MAIDERRRHDLYVRAEELLGPEPAGSLMELLPPAGAEVATRQDLENLRSATKQDLDVMAASLRLEMANLGSALRTEMHAQTKAMFLAIVSIVLTMAGLTFALAH